jgi:CBS domain-containing membrane protein
MITVDEMMTAGAKTLRADDNLADVHAALTRYNCHHVPIVNENNELEGLVSQRDVLRVSGSSLDDTGTPVKPEDILVREFMTRDVFTVKPETSLRKAAIYIRTQRYGCLPVVKDNKLVGIITDSDFVNIAIDLLEQIEESEPADQD